jgi:nicotinate-nucleotide pyrophosphorylase (carboxylating)
MSAAVPDSRLVQQLVGAALAEDRAAGDVTTAALVPADQRGRAAIVAKAEGVLAGLPVAEATFLTVDPTLRWRAHAQDGEAVRPGKPIAEIEGALASILRAERVALNFLCHLSGVATAANRVVCRLQGTSCRLRDTRKTTPGLRALEKYAVRVGGGENHRLDLADGVLIKDNHLAALRKRGLGVADAVRLARAANPGKRIEIEVTSLQEAREALETGADELLLDNMDLDEMRKIVAIVSARSPRPALEASGGITLENVRDIAETGVDYVSMGAVTHSASALDISLEVEPA